MIDLNNLLAEEMESAYKFEDERVSSDLYLTSLSYPLRSLNPEGKSPVSEIEERKNKIQWL